MNTRFQHVPLILLALVCLAASAFAADAPPLLPSQFAGWQKADVQISKDPSKIDQAYGPLLKEYGFTDSESATFQKEGRKMQVKAARFADASGAYGAFTFYKQPEMLNEKFGDQGASANERILFYRGNVLVEALLDRITAMSAAELRELAADLPLPAGSARNLPTLPTYLPHQAYVKNTAKYVVGPIGYERISAPVPASLVDFGRGAEVAVGRYNTGDGSATLELISYPTPQIAAERLRALVNSKAPGQANDKTDSFAIDGFMTKRTGPIVAVLSGNFSNSSGKSLMASVNYEADVAWTEKTNFTRRDNVANLIVAVIMLVFIMLGIMLASGLLLGGARVALRRLFPNSIFNRPDEAQFISLHLDNPAAQPSPGPSKFMIQ